MNKKEKELLLKDLCARLPYGVKGIRTYRPEETVTLGEIIPRCKMNPNVGNDSFCELGFDDTFDCCVITEFKPYLRPMSSMTEEEGVEWRELLATYPLCAEFNTDNRGWLIAHSDFILSHHFDIWNLIEKGLALEAPENMYKI